MVEFHFTDESAMITVLLLALDHNHVISVLCLDGRVGVDRLIDRRRAQRERGVLKRADHAATRHPAEIALQAVSVEFDHSPLVWPCPR